MPVEEAIAFVVQEDPFGLKLMSMILVLEDPYDLDLGSCFVLEVDRGREHLHSLHPWSLVLGAEAGILVR